MTSWHTLLGPLPPDAIPQRKPVASPEVLAKPEGAAIAGWENLLLYLSAGAAGLRVLQVLLDADGRALSASDHVLFRAEAADGVAPAEMRQESIGGRFEDDGTFRGTYWHVSGPEPVDDEEPKWEMVPREPTPEEIAALRELVAELLRRQPGRDIR
jgi:hypothetical protein